MEWGKNGKPLKYKSEYSSWANMKQRCMNPKHNSYKNYGERGITMCERWSLFALFLEDMGPKPSPKHSIDRINNDGNYEPGNCRWATKEEQCNNTRYNVLITIDGVTMSGEQWGRKNGLKKFRVNRRIKRGTPPELAVLPGRAKRHFNNKK